MKFSHIKNEIFLTYLYGEMNLVIKIIRWAYGRILFGLDQLSNIIYVGTVLSFDPILIMHEPISVGSDKF